MKALVVKVLGRYYTVSYNNNLINCVLMGRLRKAKSLEKYTNVVGVGDWVDFEMNDDEETGAISNVYDRRNAFTRKDRGPVKEDLIAANLDQIVIIQSFKKPKLNLRFVDRLYVRGEKESIPVHLCVNKYDLAKKIDADYIKDYYKNTDLTLSMISAKTGKGLSEFKSVIEGKLSIFIGNSGVGKSTILNSIYPDLNLRTSEVSESSGKGRHTTTNVEMVELPGNTSIIDTPGLREFGLMDIEPHILEQYFIDFDEHRDKCNFNPCTHDHEPKCEIKKMVEENIISKDRYISYIHILHSLVDYYKNMYK